MDDKVTIITVFVCDHKDCQNILDGFDTLEELTEHQEETHSISYNTFELFMCKCGERHETNKEAKECCNY